MSQQKNQSNRKKSSCDEDHHPKMMVSFPVNVAGSRFDTDPHSRTRWVIITTTTKAHGQCQILSASRWPVCASVFRIFHFSCNANVLI